MADLYFPRSREPKGFAIVAMEEDAGSADRVVRELLQNALDSGRGAGRAAGKAPVQVFLTIREWRVEEVPGIEAYRTAFEEARREHCKGGGSQKPAVEQTVARIRRALDRECLEVLYCTDNGQGLDDSRMRSLLTEGTGDKGGGADSAGSYGVGHLTAFAASDLRYVFYGGRCLLDEGELHEVVGGHAVLAGHRPPDGDYRSGDGYWADEPEVDLTRDDFRFPRDVPALLEQEMDEIDGAGAVVCVVGFNRFREDDGATAVEEIARVASSNFLAAIASGEMSVEIADEACGDMQCKIDRTNLEGRLQKHADRQRSRRGSGGGWLPGAQAWAAWQTLRQGRQLADLAEGVEVRFRPLSQQQAGGRSRVNVFRSGMWVTNGAPGLRPPDFADQKPFDAVVLLHDGELGRLVRKAEGPKHRDVELKRLEPPERRKRLVDMLKQIAARLREEAGPVAAGDVFRPEGFAVLDGSSLRRAERMTPYRPRQSVGGRDALAPAPGPGPGPQPKPDQEQPNPRRPKSGRSLRARAALAPVRNGSGQIDRLRVRLEIQERLAARSRLGLRVRRDSGSDESCSQPIPPEWLELEAVEHDTERSVSPNGATMELPVPPGLSAFTVVLGRPLADLRGVKIDVVQRRTETPSGTPSEG